MDINREYIESFARQYTKNAVFLKLTDKKAEPLQTKIGGKPDLPPDFEWSYYEGEDFNGVIENRPLSFIAQINCAEIKPYDKDDLLPNTGMLYFFYELGTMTWGYSPEDKGSVRVFYYDGDLSLLKQTDFPETLNKGYIIPEKTPEFVSVSDIPDYSEVYEFYGTDFHDDDDAVDIYQELRESEFSDEIRIKLLGYADLIQNTIQCECEYVSRGYDYGNGIPDTSEEEKADIEKKAADWILLFQLDTVEADDYELMFGDCGRIYFYIRKKDLAERNFDNVQLILQCC